MTIKIKGLKNFNIEKVPFVPALDLLEMETNKLSDTEAATLAVALFRSLGGRLNRGKTAWEINSRKEALLQRI